jgi:hypothetical protein
METDFARGLDSLATRYGAAALVKIGELIQAEEPEMPAASEAVRWLGRRQEAQTHALRLWLIEQALSSPVPAIRDSAGLALASLDDPSAIPTLQAAIARERIEELRQDLELVLDQLESARRCPSS